MTILKGRTFYITAFLLTLSFLTGSWFFTFLLSILMGGYIWLYRVTEPSSESEFANRNGILLAPCSGKVLSINPIESEKFSTKVVFSIPWWGPYEIKFPDDWEISQISKHFLVPDIKEKRWYFTEFRDKNYSFVICLSKLSRLSHFNYWIQAGDRGKRGHSLGILYMGGIIELLLPYGHKINIKAGDEVKMGATVLALEGQEI